MQSSFQAPITRLHLHAFESLLLGTNICSMDNHPLARRPHKLPAHTVKDLRGRPQRLSRLTPPHQSARGSRLSYSEFRFRQHRVEIFFRFRRSVQPSFRTAPGPPGRASYSMSENRQPPRFIPSFPRPAEVKFTVAGRALCTRTTRIGRGKSKNSLRIFC